MEVAAQARRNLRPRRPRAGDVDPVDSVFAVPAEFPIWRDHFPDQPHHQGRSAGTLARCKAAKTFCWVARKPDAETARPHSRSKSPRHLFSEGVQALLSEEELAAQVIGLRGHGRQGLSGIEREFDDELQRQAGQMMISVDAHKKWFGSVEKQPEPGENIVLTIDQQIQYIAERELEVAMQQTHAVSGTVIVENPHTGEILALANRPTFNPNISREITPAKLKNHAVSDVLRARLDVQTGDNCGGAGRESYPPGRSVRLPDGSIVFNGMRIRDSRPHGLLRSRMFWRNRATWARSRSACDWATTDSTNTFGIRIRSADRHRTARRNSRPNQTGKPLVKSFDCRDFDGPGDRDHSAAACRT